MWGRRWNPLTPCWSVLKRGIGHHYASLPEIRWDISVEKRVKLVKWGLLWILECNALVGREGVAADSEQHPGQWRSVCAV